MATRKPRAILPVRVARLHGRLLISVAIGILITLATTATNWQWATRLLAGWDTGVLVYLVLILFGGAPRRHPPPA